MHMDAFVFRYSQRRVAGQENILLPGVQWPRLAEQCHEFRENNG
jgi:hypothetical protein